MNKIKAEIEQHMTGPGREGMSLTSRFAFPPEFIGFQGHFPQKKILPGVCQIQLVLSTLAKGLGTPVSLKEIVLAKYFSPVFPDDEITCVISDIGDGKVERIVRAAITKTTLKVAEFKLRVSGPGEGHKG